MNNMFIFNKKYIKETFKYLLRSSFFIKKYVNEIETMYAMTPKELRARNEQRFLKLFKKAFLCSEYYRSLCYKVGVLTIDDIKCLEDLVKLPILNKDILKKHGKELLVRKERGLIKNHTSGTTGTPLTVWQDWASVWREQAYFVCYRKRCGYNYGEPIVSLRGNLGKNEISLKVHISNTLFLSSYNINAYTAKTYYQLIEKHRPKAIEGYPSSLYSLALVLSDQGLECHIPLAFTSSETMHDYQKNLIEKVFHTQIYDHYGTTERSIRLEESFDHDGYFEDPGYGIEEYHDNYVITTSLINDVFPLIRYQTNDSIKIKTSVNPTKTYSPTIERIEGRSISYIVGKDGTKYSDSALTFIFKKVHGIRFAQFVQNKIGKVIVNIVVEPTFNDDDKKCILKYINQTVGTENMDIEVRLIPESELQYTKRNKLALVVSNL